MNRRIALLIVSATLFIASCTKDDPPPPAAQLSVDKTDINLSGFIGAIDSITINTDQAWTIAAAPAVDWLQVEAASGTGTTIVRVQNAKEYAGTPAQVTLTIAAADSNVPPVTVKISQQPYFTLQYSKLQHIDESQVFNGSVATPDGGVIMVGGVTRPNPISLMTSQDGLIVKYSATGEIQWTKILGGSTLDVFRRITATTDGNYIAAGHTASNNGDISGNHGRSDLWVVKIDGAGNVVWNKCYGGTSDEYMDGVASQSGGGCVVAANAGSMNGDISGAPLHNFQRAWILSINADGSIQNSHTLERADHYITALNMISDQNGRFILVGQWNTPVMGGTSFPWMAQISATGEVAWEKKYDGNIFGQDIAVAVARDGGYLLSHKCFSQVRLQFEGRLIKAGANGNIVWETFAKLNDNIDEVIALAAIPDGGYYWLLYTSLNDGTVPGFKGERDAWLINVDNKGAKRWSKALGGTKNDRLYTISRTTNNQFVLGGVSNSNDGDLTGNQGGRDAWILKFK